MESDGASALPANLADPIALRFWETGIWVLAAALIMIGVWQTIRARRMSLLLLMVVASMSTFWLEYFGDWGTYLLYNPAFASIDVDVPLTAPVKPWWCIGGYAVFYPALYGILIGFVALVRRRAPHSNVYVWAIIAAFPVFYLFDFAFELTAVYCGWWDYTYAFGPAFHVRGGQFPLVWPILQQIPFIALAAVALTWRDGHDNDAFRRAASQVRAGAPREAAVTGIWIAADLAASIVLTFLPLVGLRLLIGPASTLVP